MHDQDIAGTAGVTAAALEWHAAGASVVRTRSDGSEQSKAPAGAWKQYQVTAPAEAEVLAWAGNGSAPDGFGVICGKVSGNLDMFEFEGRAIAEGVLEAFNDVLARRGLAPLWGRVVGGYCDQSPSGGIHVLYRVGDGKVPGNTKLAERPARDDEITAAERETMGKRPGWVPRRVLIETRGEGGFTVVAPSGGRTHPTGLPWVLLSGGPGSVAVITAAEREALAGAARELSQMPARGPATSAGGQATAAAAPGSWHEIMALGGWAHAGTDDRGHDLWTRPGKDAGTSATTSEDGGLYVFSSSTEFEPEVPYSRAAVLAVFRDGLDPAEALARFGTPADQARAVEAAWRAAAGTPAEQLAVRPAALDGDEARREPLEVTSAAVLFDVLCAGLGTGSLSGVFNRADELVVVPRYGEIGYRPAGQARTAQDPPAQIRPLAGDGLLSFIAGRRLCYRTDKDGRISRALPPAGACRAVTTAMPEAWAGVPPLAGVTHTPLLRPDGSVLAQPGYDPATRLLYLPECEVPPVPEVPAAGDVESARDFLLWMIRDFPFCSDGDRANYLGMLITPLLRTLLPPPWPQLGLNAPQPGSGKTLLATLLRIAYGGTEHPAPAGQPSDVDTELRKLISTVLDSHTGTVVVFDNITGVFRSGTVAKLLTGLHWADRELGRNRAIHGINDRIWVLTGNNLQIGGDLPRRTVWCSIDAGCEHPENRKVTVPDLPGWAEANRGAILHAGLVLARAAAPGLSRLAHRRNDGYGRWDAGIRHVLAVAGLGAWGFWDPATSVTTTGEDDAEWAEFLAAVYSAWGSRPWTARQLADACAGSFRRTVIGEALPGDLGEMLGKHLGDPGILARKLGWWLKNRRGRWADGYMVWSADAKHARSTAWYIKHAE